MVPNRLIEEPAREFVGDLITEEPEVLGVFGISSQMEREVWL
jgi:hypothetical protein